MKRVGLFVGFMVCLTIAFSLLSLNMMGGDPFLECECLDQNAVQNGCASQSEYIGHEIVISFCDYNACDAEVMVHCFDNDANEVYVELVSSWKVCNDDCSGGSGGDDDWWDDLI